MTELSSQTVMESPIPTPSSETIVYQMVTMGSSHEEVFNIVNYNVTDEIDEGYSTNYSPSSKSTSSFDCDSSFEQRAENTDVQVKGFSSGKIT